MIHSKHNNTYSLLVSLCSRSATKYVLWSGGSCQSVNDIIKALQQTELPQKRISSIPESNVLGANPKTRDQWEPDLARCLTQKNYKEPVVSAPHFFRTQKHLGSGHMSGQKTAGTSWSCGSSSSWPTPSDPVAVAPHEQISCGGRSATLSASRKRQSS